MGQSCFLCLIIYIYIANKIDIVSNNISESKYLIYSGGCRIPDYTMHYDYNHLSQMHTCKRRLILIKKVYTDTISFNIKQKNLICDYRYINRSKKRNLEDILITYSPPYSIINNVNVTLKQDLIKVTCRKNGRHPVYKDFYAFVKKINRNFTQMPDRPWNVLLIGLDSMSRSRAYDSLEKTVKFLLKNEWLDFRGYNKVAGRTLPNLMTILTGKNLYAEEENCRTNLSSCNHLMMWHKYQEAGYVTAQSEDAVYMQGSFPSNKGFKVPPTDHYLRPVFLAGERKIAHGLICTGRMSSGQLTLDYIRDFTETYKNNRFFGFFWISSASHDANQTLHEFDKPMLNFLKKIKKSDVLKNTFIFFFSDHGLRYGSATYPIESFYDDRLPMLFIWVPTTFRQRYPRIMSNLRLNQQRLVSAYDIHITLLDILKRLQKFYTIPILNLCPKCHSLFNEISGDRNCTDAGIPDQYCSCREMQKMNISDNGAKTILTRAVKHILFLSRTIKTSYCTLCSKLVYKNLLSLQSLSDTKGIYYNAAFEMMTDFYKQKKMSITFEVTIRKTKHENNTVYEILSTKTLSKQNDIGNCALQPEHRKICICRQDPNCF